ncbi:hypothetical protein X777_02244, partial [Ooceraea biroi]
RINQPSVGVVRGFIIITRGVTRRDKMVPRGMTLLPPPPQIIVDIKAPRNDATERTNERTDGRTDGHRCKRTYVHERAPYCAIKSNQRRRCLAARRVSRPFVDRPSFGIIIFFSSTLIRRERPVATLLSTSLRPLPPLSLHPDSRSTRIVAYGVAALIPLNDPHSAPSISSAAKEGKDFFYYRSSTLSLPLPTLLMLPSPAFAKERTQNAPVSSFPGASASLLSRRSLPEATILELLGAHSIRTYLQPRMLLSLLSLPLLLACSLRAPIRAASGASGVSNEMQQVRAKVVHPVAHASKRERERERDERDSTGWLVEARATTLFPEGTEPGVRSRAEGTDIRPNDCHVITG